MKTDIKNVFKWRGVAALIPSKAANDRIVPAVASGSFLLLIYFLYILYGHSVIKLMYDGHAAGILNTLIQSQNTYSIQHYLEKADRAIIIIITYFVFFIICFLLSNKNVPYKHLLYFNIFIFLSICFIRVYGHDTDHHLFRISQVLDSLKLGDFPIYISSDAANGKGLPIFVIYTSWTYFIPAFFSWLGLSPFSAIKVVWVFLFLFSQYGMYRVLRLFVDHAWALMGTLIYVSSNYYLGDIFVRGAFAEFHAYSFLPWVFLFLIRWLDSPKFSDASILALTSSLMFVVHPLSFANSLIGLLICAIFIMWDRTRAKVKKWHTFLAQGCVMSALFFAITSFYWLPFIMEKKYFNLQNNIFEAFADKPFLAIKDYLSFFYFVNLGFLLSLGILLGLAILMRGVLSGRSRYSLLSSALALVCFVYFFLTLKSSQWFWEKIPFLFHNNQWLWRLFVPMSFFGTMFAIIELQKLLRNHSIHFKNKVCSILSVLLFIQGVFFVTFNVGHAVLIKSNGDYPDTVSRYRALEEGWGINEFFPNIASIPRVLDKKPLGQLEFIKRIKEKGRENIWFKKVDEAGFYELRKYWNTRYEIYLYGEKSTCYSNDKGMIVLSLPEGAKQILLVYTRPSYVLVSEIIACLGLGVCFLGILLSHCRHLFDKKAVN